MEIIPTEIDGCVEVHSRVFTDDRGTFVKTFHADQFHRLGLNGVWREYFYSSSALGVVRGLHFQVPPTDHIKLVTCVVGAVWDVVVDLRRTSPTYGKHVARELTADRGSLLYIPRGMAHGFLSLSEGSVMLYAVETVHDSQCDKGIRWDSCGISWPSVGALNMSKRDATLPPFDNFESPF